jgi:hypothetical protein
MRLILRCLYLALGFVAPAPAWATTGDCGDLAPLLQHAYPAAVKTADGKSLTVGMHSISLALPDSDTFAVVCKQWPAHDDLLLVAVPLMDTKQSSDDGHVGDVELLVLDRTTLQVRQRLLQPGLMTDDAIAIRGIELDTGRYGLAHGVTAFGLRIDMANHSQPNPFSETDLRLYAPTGDALRLVLDGMVVAGNGGEGDTNCAGSFHTSQASLEMGKAVHQGYRDIVVVARTDTDNPLPDQNGECQSHPGKSVSATYRLRYDGKRYPVPAALQALGQ